ncbi:MAG: 1-pyrroline-5-carboxylate dehydrogenase, partial [Pseudonocardiales bacterium]
MDAVTAPPDPVNEPIRSYAMGSPERTSLEHRLKEMGNEQIDLTITVGGEQRMAGGEPYEVVQPHRHSAVLGTLKHATAADVRAAAAAAKEAAPAWRALPYDERAAVLLRAAELLAGPWRDTINAATMLGQSKSVLQAEIDAACELIDFLRFNVAFGRQILGEQPRSTSAAWNRFDHRPLEGFVLAIAPFNFTSIAANLALAPALMGNTVVWKPSPTQQLSAHYLMRLFEAAGLPPGVVNLVTGDGKAVSEVALADPDLAGIHFTGSTGTFQHLWRTVGDNISAYKTYPRLVGETGGKDFVFAHPSADPAALHTALIRGAFEYQGQKCSAASRAYIPRSLWDDGFGERLGATTDCLLYGDVTVLSNFGGAVIDARAFARLAAAIDRFREDDACTIVAGGAYDDSEGYLIRPTVVECTDPTHEVFTAEYFGPILSVFVYDDAEYEAVLRQAADVAPYALTGAVFATDRAAIDQASEVLRFSAGNFYVN